MMRMRVGGILPDQEGRGTERGFWNGAIPSTCVVPLQQHRGSQIKPMVSVGDTVREGMLIADGDLRLSVPVHAPIPGTVEAIGPIRLVDNSESLAISIALSGEFDRLGKRWKAQSWDSLDAATLRDIVRNAGIVTNGRTALPAYQYLDFSQDSSPVVLVLDLAETEPFLTADYELARELPQEVVQGMQIMTRITGAVQTHVICASSFRDTLAAITRAAPEDYRFHTVHSRYPANLESDFLQIVTTSSGIDPGELTICPVSPGTAYAVYEAVVLGKAYLDRVITVAGGAVARPAHVRVRFGTSIADVLEECGGLTATPARIIAGGPFSGRSVENVYAPVSKTTTALLALTASEVRDEVERPCISCGACSRACPVSLEPQMLYEMVRQGNTEAARAAGIDRCVECGLCSHVCPSRIPLVRAMQEGKS